MNYTKLLYPFYSLLASFLSLHLMYHAFEMAITNDSYILFSEKFTITILYGLFSFKWATIAFKYLIKTIKEIIKLAKKAIALNFTQAAISAIKTGAIKIKSLWIKSEYYIYGILAAIFLGSEAYKFAIDNISFLIDSINSFIN